MPGSEIADFLKKLFIGNTPPRRGHESSGRTLTRANDLYAPKTQPISAIFFEFRKASPADQHHVALAGKHQRPVFQRRIFCIAEQRNLGMVFEKEGGPFTQARADGRPEDICPVEARFVREKPLRQHLETIIVNRANSNIGLADDGDR